jgi:hypothetical protein
LDLLKANLMNNQEVSLMKFAIRCNVMRVEEGDDKIWFTNNQGDVENYRNQTIKFNTQVGDLRIRKESDGLPKELKPPRIVTLKKEERSMRKNLRLKEAEEVRLRKEKHP